MQYGLFVFVKGATIEPSHCMGILMIMSAADFGQLKTSETEDFELVKGQLIPLSGRTPLHAKMRRRLERALERCFEQKPLGESLGEIDCRLSNDTVRRPDVSIFLKERLQRIDWNRIPVPFAPDIAVEILSPSESAIDVHRKVREYLGAGTEEVWILDYVNAELFVHSQAGIRLLVETDVLESSLLPGFATQVAELFVGLSEAASI